MLTMFFSRLLDSNGWLLFVFFCLVLWILVFLNKEYVVTEQLYDNYVESKMQEKYDDYDQLSAEFDEDIENFEDEESNQWADVLFDFGFVTLQNVLQFTFISAFIYVGLTLKQVTEEITYRSVFKVVIASEFIFFIPKIIKYSWFIIRKGDYVFEDVQNFNPFSLYGLFEPSEVAEWLTYPLKFINVFEIIYIILLPLGISLVSKVKIENVIFPVVTSYLFLMLLWISLRIYLSTIF